MQSTSEGSNASSAEIAVRRSKSVKRLDMMSEEDRLMRGVEELKTAVTMAVSATCTGVDVAAL
jgi:hypothetical protein